MGAFDISKAFNKVDHLNEQACFYNALPNTLRNWFNKCYTNGVTWRSA